MGIRALMLTRIVGRECHAGTNAAILPLGGMRHLLIYDGYTEAFASRHGEVAESGRLHLTRNQAYLHGYRGFESLPLRHRFRINNPVVLSRTVTNDPFA